MQTRISVLVADSTKMNCDLLRKAFVAVRCRFQVVAFALSRAEVLTAVQQHRPQIAVISCDLDDGPMSGLKTVPEIRDHYPNTKILLVTALPNKDLVIEAFRLGAVGVFNRNSAFEMLCKSIDVVSRGQIWASSEELHDVLRAFAKAPKLPKLDPTVESRFTRREAAVVRLAIEGLPNREIARQLMVSEHTVKNYLFKVFDKLGVSNRVELVLSCIHQRENANHESTLAEAPPPLKFTSVAKTAGAVRV
jgi:DNA-binding NarL/FixJ family response regulator